MKHGMAVVLVSVWAVFAASEQAVRAEPAAPEKKAETAGTEKKGESPDPYAGETPAERDARMKWWREAKFGLFIHWGVYAVPAGTWNGKQIGGIGEWIMNKGRIPCADYQQFAKQFNPVKYNADDWVQMARDAGMKYIVITSKHHDGFALFGSQASDWNVVKASPYGKDLLQPLAEACRKHGLKLGFYYSQAQDWNNGGSAARGKWDKAQDRSMDDYIDKVAVPQVREILTSYGEFPAVLWWDTPTGMNKERADKLVALLKLKPGIIHNNRLGGGYKGDTETPEQHIPATGYPGRDWETCMTMNGTWGFKSYDNNWKSTKNLIQNLVDIVSKGGNYLLNVGPTAEGLIPQPSVDHLKEIGAWMKMNGEAIYGTSASVFKKLPFNGRCTRKGNKLYLHVFDWPAPSKVEGPAPSKVEGPAPSKVEGPAPSKVEGPAPSKVEGPAPSAAGKPKLIVPLDNAVKSAVLLADAGTKLPAAKTDAGVEITLPEKAPDPIASVIVLEIEGDPKPKDLP